MSSVEMKKTGFVDAANMARRKTPQNWVILIELVEGKMVRYKAFGTWVQEMTIEGVDIKFSSTPGINVQQHKQWLDQILTKYL